MFPFESQVKLLAGFSLVVPIIFFITQLSHRINFEITGEIPKWVRSVNFDVSGEIIETSQRFQNLPVQDIILILTWYGNIILHFGLAIHLWISSHEGKIIKLVIWFVACGTLIASGMLILKYIYRSVEIGLAFIFVKLSFVYMVFTMFVVGLLILKIRLENNESSMTN